MEQLRRVVANQFEWVLVDAVLVGVFGNSRSWRRRDNGDSHWFGLSGTALIVIRNDQVRGIGTAIITCGERNRTRVVC